MSNSRVLVFTSRQTIRWGDLDALGHVNNTLYFKYMEQCRSEWMYSRGEGSGHKSDIGGPVRRLCRHLRCHRGENRAVGRSRRRATTHDEKS